MILPKQVDAAELVVLDLLDEITLAALEETRLAILDDLMLEIVDVLELDLLVATELEMPTLDLFDELMAVLDALAGGTEHSLIPPSTVLPAPKVASLQTKLPLNTL